MSKSTFTPENVRELAMELREKTIPSGYEVVITEWLEQNPIEPQVVGLSDEQITSFIETYKLHSLVGMHLREWQKTLQQRPFESRELLKGVFKFCPYCGGEISEVIEWQERVS